VRRDFRYKYPKAQLSEEGPRGLKRNLVVAAAPLSHHGASVNIKRSEGKKKSRKHERMRRSGFTRIKCRQHEKLLIYALCVGTYE